MISAGQGFPRRFAGAAAGILLHIFAIAMLVAALNAHLVPWQPAREIQLLLLRPPPPPPLKSDLLPPLPATTFPLLEAPEPIVPPPSAPAISAIPMPPEIAGVGKALFGCAPEAPADTEQRAQCPHAMFGTPKAEQAGLGPPPDPDSPWAKVIAERNTPAIPINHPCPLGSYNDTHGLPCFAFDQKSPLLDALH